MIGNNIPQINYHYESQNLPSIVRSLVTASLDPEEEKVRQDREDGHDKGVSQSGAATSSPVGVVVSDILRGILSTETQCHDEQGGKYKNGLQFHSGR